MSNSNKDLFNVAVQIGSLIISGATTVRKIEEANRNARRAGREAPMDKIKNWFF